MVYDSLGNANKVGALKAEAPKEEVRQTEKWKLIFESLADQSRAIESNTDAKEEDHSDEESMGDDTHPEFQLRKSTDLRKVSNL